MEYTRYTLDELREQQQRFANRFNKPAVTELRPDPEAGQVLRSGPVQLSSAVSSYEIMQDVIRSRPTPKVLPYQNPALPLDARRLFASILCLIEDNITESRKEVFRFKWSEAQAEVIRALIKHAINDPTSPIPLNKGWYLWGDTQKGKTTLARALMAFHTNISALRKRESPKGFRFSDVHQMFADFEVQERLKIDHYYNFDRLFDDVGCETETRGLMVYGQHRDPIAEILWQRHRAWQEFGRLTYFTSNIPFESIRTSQCGTVVGWLNRFDERMQARLRDMIHPILLPS